VLNTSYLNLKLSESQEKAIGLLDDFLEGDEKIFILKGYAGTGKTTLLKLLINSFIEYSIPFYLAAPTGRAAKIIAEKTGMRTSTIHKLIYSYSNIFSNESEGQEVKFYFALKKNNGLRDSIILIDEASMISGSYNSNEYISFGSGKLLHDLIKYIDPMNNNNKIIFIGDDAQLPPINSNKSPALTVSYLGDEFGFKDIMVAELREVFRQESGSEILVNATKIRESIENNDYRVFLIEANGYNIVKINENNVANEYINVRSNLSSDINENIIITFSNKKAFIYNQDIRNLIFKGHKNKRRVSKIYDKNIKDININDILIIMKNNCFYKEVVDKKEEVAYIPIELYNGEIVKVLEVEPISAENRKNILIKIDNKKKYVKLVFRDVLIEYKSYDGVFSVIKVKILENYLLGHEAILSAEQNLALYVDFVKRFKQKNKGKFERIGSMKDLENTELFRQEMRKDPFFNALLVKYGYAITCHKAQGGEWENVFVDFDMHAKNHSEYFYRWSYTAISRTKNQLYLINSPEYTLDSEQIIQYEYIVDDKMSFPNVKDERKMLTAVYEKELNIGIEVLEKIYKIPDNQILQLLFKELYGLTGSSGIFIHHIEHKTLVERYYFVKGSEIACIDFGFNKTGFSYIKPCKTNSIEFMEELKSLLEAVV